MIELTKKAYDSFINGNIQQMNEQLFELSLCNLFEYFREAGITNDELLQMIEYYVNYKEI